MARNADAPANDAQPPTDTDADTDDVPSAHALKAYEGRELVQRDDMMSSGILIEAAVAVDTARDATIHNFAVPDRDNRSGFKTVHRDHEEITTAMRADGEWQTPRYDPDEVPDWVPHSDEEVDD